MQQSIKQPIEDSGVIRLSPLMRAVASSKSSATAEEGAINAVTGRSSVDSGVVSVLPPGVAAEDVANAQERAAQGDQEAIDWLKAAGIVAGTAAVAGGAYAIKRALSNRNKKTLPPNFGAGDVAVKTQAGNTSTATSKALPHVTQLRDEVIIPHAEELQMPAPAMALRKAAAAIRRIR